MSTSMKLQPVENYRRPDYPTQEILEESPKLLRIIPRRWKGNRAVLSALAGILALMNQSCTSSTDPNRGKLAGAKTVLIPTEDESHAVPVWPSNKPQNNWAPIPGKIAIPKAVIPEDQAKAQAVSMGAPTPPPMQTEEEIKAAQDRTPSQSEQK